MQITIKFGQHINLQGFKHEDEDEYEEEGDGSFINEINKLSCDGSFDQ